MNAVLWVVAGIAVLLFGWWALKILMSLTVPPEVSGRAFLKQQLKRRGVDVARIPDRAIDEIVQHCLSAAKGIAMMNQLSSHGRPDDKNWRANLVRQLEAHAPLVQSIMNGERPSLADSKIREILIRNGVVNS